MLTVWAGFASLSPSLLPIRNCFPVIGTIPAGVGGLSGFAGSLATVAMGLALSGPATAIVDSLVFLTSPPLCHTTKINNPMAETPIAAAPIYLAGLARFTFAVTAACSPLVRRPARTPIAGLAR